MTGTKGRMIMFDYNNGSNGMNDHDNTQFQVEMRYHLSQEEAGKYMKQYWK